MKQLLFIALLFISTSLKSQVESNDSLYTSKVIVLYFPWDKDTLYTEYMTNKETLKEIDRLFSNSILLSRMDSVVISATASPEGPPVYNQKLSERRLATVLRFLQNKYPAIESGKIRAYALGENWEGLLHMVKADEQVPYRDEVIQLIEMPIDKVEMERRLNRIGKGVAYQYIKYHILPYLRIGGTCVVFYPERMKVLYTSPATTKLPVTEPPVPVYDMQIPSIPDYRYIRPLALKTNLLFDIATLFNIELEVPIGRHWSLAGEWIFPWWGGLGNDGGVSPVPHYSEKYTMQMLSGGLEARYWFPRSKSQNRKAECWGDYNPLNGWFVGLYAGAGKYDFQLGGDGMQGEFFIASGISAGYAHPIAKHWHMEYSIGIGYLDTQYYNYIPLDGHKVVKILSNGQYDRRKQKWFGPTKTKVSLVWIPRFKLKNKK